MEYNSVIFDMDGVILDYEGENFNWIYSLVRDALEQKDVDAENLSRSELDAFLGERGVQDCVEICNKYDVDARTVWTELADATTYARAERIENGNFCLFPEAKGVLRQLHEEGMEMALVSNAPESAIEVMIENYGLRKYFEYFRGISSFDDLSDRKPHPDHLNFAKAELKHGPFVFVGDSESDIIAAQNAGMDSVWINRDGGSIDTRPDYEIEDLEELLRVVKEKPKQEV